MEKNKSRLDLFRGKILKDIDLKEYSFMHTGGIAKMLLLPTSVLDLKIVCDEYGNDIDVIGNGSNVLFRGNVNRILVMKYPFDSLEINIENKEMVIGAGRKLQEIARFAYEKSFSGMEELVGIPGTVGGAIKMNAGAYGKTIFDLVEGITVFDMNDREVKHLDIGKIKPKYRDGGIPEGMIILNATLKFKKSEKWKILDRMENFSRNRRAKQPMGGYFLGSIFKNPEKYPAGWLIEECGLKGKRIGGAFVSEKHANFIINDGTATSDDVIRLIDIIKKTVFDKFGIKLELEIVII